MGKISKNDVLLPHNKAKISFPTFNPFSTPESHNVKNDFFGGHVRNGTKSSVFENLKFLDIGNKYKTTKKDERSKEYQFPEASKYSYLDWHNTQPNKVAHICDSVTFGTANNYQLVGAFTPPSQISCGLRGLKLRDSKTQ